MASSATFLAPFANFMASIVQVKGSTKVLPEVNRDIKNQFHLLLEAIKLAKGAKKVALEAILVFRNLLLQDNNIVEKYIKVVQNITLIL